MPLLLFSTWIPGLLVLCYELYLPQICLVQCSLPIDLQLQYGGFTGDQANLYYHLLTCYVCIQDLNHEIAKSKFGFAGISIALFAIKLLCPGPKLKLCTSNQNLSFENFGVYFYCDICQVLHLCSRSPCHKTAESKLGFSGFLPNIELLCLCEPQLCNDNLNSGFQEIWSRVLCVWVYEHKRSVGFCCVFK